MKPNRSYRFILIIISLGIILSACSGTQNQPAETSLPEPTQQGASESVTQEAPYPAPKDYEPTEGPYPPPPLPTVAYPAPGEAPTQDPSIIKFNLDKPIYAGDTVISGTGPAGVPIAILDITFMGEVLGQTVIKDDGTFSIEVSPLEAAHRVGIILGVLEGTEWSETDFDERYFGDQALNVPLVGFFYDTALVLEK